ncbi:MAG: folylpolyglutamate synthase/dihydrofolate synthase family protein [Desulfobacterales bacterium]|nr:folylpolyglutamate synthase/dihydrofolate synthase family protein [Desulfobacterales bacterium]
MGEYEKCLETMYSLHRFGIKLGLDVMRNILSGLDRPQQRFKSVHVAGTNGKGSVASMLTAILQEAGFTVGLYTSPHLVHFNERIRINGRPISNREVVAAYKAVKAVHSGDREPTFFEFSTAMALYAFGQRPVDWAVIETGMGGRLDATNMLSPEACIITNISLEHCDYLGNTISAVAGEKAGIIKENTPLVTGVKQPAAVWVTEAKAAAMKAPCIRQGPDFRTRQQADGHFTYFGVDHKWAGLKTPLLGEHQVSNASLALAAAEVLIQKGVPIDEAHVRKGLMATQWPGRLETVCEKPHIILDGAHNLAAARNLGRYLQNHLKDRNILMVVGILDDKPYSGMLSGMLPPCRRAIITAPKIGRAVPAQTLADTALHHIRSVDVVPHVAQAVEQAVKTAGPQDTIVVAGSLYVVGEAIEALQDMGLMPPPA